MNLIDPDGRAAGNPSTDVKRNKDGSYTVVGAKNDGDRNIYVVGENRQRTGEVIGTTVKPFDFMSTDDKTGGFHFRASETGVTFRMDNLTVSGTVQVNESTTASIYSANASELVSWATGLFIQEFLKTSGNTYAGLKLLSNMSRNGGPLDLKESLGLHPYTPIRIGDNSNMITTLRGIGNMIFGINIAHTKPMLNWFGDKCYYSTVMKQVGVYNQSQNKGSGYNAGWPFYGEHTYSGTYIYFGYFGQMP